MTRPLVAVVLAAGQGTRMRSRLPKVLHRACGRPLVRWVVEAAVAVGPSEILVVVGHGADRVVQTVEALDLGVPVRSVVQDEQRGTGDAARVALGALEPGERDVLVLPGDMPLLRPETLQQMLDKHERDETAATVLTARLSDPTGYGRVIRNIGGGLSRIVEQTDASPDQIGIDEVAVSTYLFDEERLRGEIHRLSPDNAQGELYLPDAVAHLQPDVDSIVTEQEQVLGVNDRAQLSAVEALLRRRINTHWMREGVTMRDPDRTYVDADVTIAPDVELLPGCLLEGSTAVGEGSVIGPDVRVVDSRIGAGCVLSHCVVRESEIADGADVGPYASLRPATHLGADAHVGTFVETKKATVGTGSKIPHLSYIGDATIGDDVNLGANTITCNWDGVAKHHTHIEDGVRTGTGTRLVAPIRIGRRAYTGAGAVVTHDVPADGLAKGMPARNEEGWTSRNRPTPEDEK